MVWSSMSISHVEPITADKLHKWLGSEWKMFAAWSQAGSSSFALPAKLQRHVQLDIKVGAPDARVTVDGNMVYQGEDFDYALQLFNFSVG